jgi:hypothetical protein
LNLLIARQHSPTYLTSCLLFFSCLFALMSKESAIAMLPLTFLYLAINRTKMRTRNALLLIIPIALATILYFCLRSGMHSLTDQGIINSVSVKNSLGEIILADLAAYGFYLRKMLFPFPLNMAITNISFPVNLIVCVVLFLFMALSFWRKKELRIPLIIVLTGLAPPILALNGGLPWTPYAERYTYLPLTGGVIIMGIVLMHYGRKLPYAILVIGVLILALPTVLRITVWCDPISFWRDAVAQSPKYAPVRLLLAGELIKNGKKKEAKEELVKANNLGLSRKVDKKDYAKLMHDIEKTNPNSL